MATRRSSSRSKTRGHAKAVATINTRARIVWATLLVTLTVVGGSLYAIGGQGSSSRNTAPMPLVMATSAQSFASIFNNPVPLRSWDRIVVVDTGAPFASVDTLDARAKELGEPTGIGYHFVIGNGRNLTDGQIRPCPRWRSQKPASSAYGSDLGTDGTLVICLVGDTKRSRVTDDQAESLKLLVAQLANTLKIPSSRVEFKVGSGLNTSFMANLGAASGS